MPCVSDFTSQADRDRDAAARVRQIEQPIRKELDYVTRLLCEVMSTSQQLLPSTTKRNETHMVRVSPELQSWWFKHQEADRKRKEKEEKEKHIWELEREVERLKKEIK